ncbi:MAG: hypothetical protein Kow006_22890 [Gammaproteobacteria bacterium]
MESAPYLWSFASELLTILLILAMTGFLVVRHRKNLLALLVDKQSELIKKLSAETGAEKSNDRAAYHLRDTAKWIQSRYRIEYGGGTDLAGTEFDESGRRRVEMLVAMQTLGRELQAYRDQLEPEASWAEIQPALNKVLTPLYAAAEAVPVVSEIEEPGDTPGTAEPEGRLAAEQQRADELAEELRQAKTVHQELLEALRTKARESNEWKEWLEGWFGGVETGGKMPDEIGEAPREDIMNRALADSLQKSEAEMKALRNALAGQHELVARLKYKLSQEETAAEPIQPEELEALSRMLRESETCIQTLEMELEQTHAQVARLEQQLEEAKSALEEDAVTREFIQKSAQETKEMLGCIRTLEDTCDSQAAEIAQLEDKLRLSTEEIEALRARLGEGGETPPADDGGDDATPDAEMTQASDTEKGDAA